MAQSQAQARNVLRRYTRYALPHQARTLTAAGESTGNACIQGTASKSVFCAVFVASHCSCPERFRGLRRCVSYCFHDISHSMPRPAGCRRQFEILSIGHIKRRLDTNNGPARHLDINSEPFSIRVATSCARLAPPRRALTVELSQPRS
jgi:hypothetical protein